MKDYVKRTSVPSAIYTRRKSAPSSWTVDRFLLIFIVMMIIFAAIFGARSFYLKHKAVLVPAAPVVENTVPSQKVLPSHVADTSEKAHNKSPVLSEKEKAKIKTAADKSRVASASNEPKYDFYQMLPKMTVDVEKEDGNPPSA